MKDERELRAASPRWILWKHLAEEHKTLLTESELDEVLRLAGAVNTPATVADDDHAREAFGQMMDDAIDAGRYRWLRDNTYVQAFWIDASGGVDSRIRVRGSLHFLDRAIDVEREARGP